MARRFPLWLRWVLAGPVALIISIALMAASTIVIPKGAAGINNIAFALALFPAFWGVVFFYVILEESPWRASMVSVALLLASGAAIYSQFA